LGTGFYLGCWQTGVEQDRIGYPGYDDMKVAGELARVNPELEYKKVEGVYIDGGNQLADRKNIFVAQMPLPSHCTI